MTNSQKKLTKIAWKNGILHYFNVWSNNKIIGNGYCVSYRDEVGEPVLMDLNGEALPQEWYTLQMTEYKPCIVPRNKQ